MENGIVIKGKYYPAEWMDDVIEIVVDKATKRVMSELKSHFTQKEKDEMYTVEEIATIVKKSIPTVTRHIRIGLLRGHKVGKTWLVTKESLEEYRLNPD